MQRSPTPRIKLETKKLLLQYRSTRSPSIRSRVVSLNFNLCRLVAKRCADTEDAQQELAQVGAIGLCKAVDKFDCDLGFEFSSCAVPLIRGEILHWLRDNPDYLRGIRIPRPYQDSRRFVEKTHQQLVALGRSITLEETAKLCLVDDWSAVVSATQPGLVTSSDASDYDQLASTEDDQRESALSALENLEAIPKELVRLHYIEGLSERDIAQRYRLSVLAVKIVLAESIKKLRRELL